MYRNSFVLRFPLYPPSETEKRDESLSAQEIFRRIFGRIAASHSLNNHSVLAIRGEMLLQAISTVLLTEH